MPVKLASLTCLGFVTCVAACATRPPPTEADRALAARVESALNDDPKIYARHVDVSAHDGVVHLSGFVWSPNEVLYAKNDAKAVPGVQGVSNDLELMRGGLTGGSR